MNFASLNQDLLKRLAEHSSPNALLSVYLPTTARPDEAKKNEIRFKNAQREAEKQLLQAGCDDKALQAIVEPLATPDERLWKHAGSGIALLMDDESATCVQLPDRPGELVVAAARYHLKPLFHTLTFKTKFYLLALSQNEVRLFAGHRTGLHEVDLHDDVPASLPDAVGRELSEPSLQHHSGDRGSSEAIFHGQGAGKDQAGAELEKFLHETDKALQKHHLNGPVLVLAGTAELTAAFRNGSDYAALLADDVAGNVEHLDAHELHEQCWPLVRERLQADRNEELNKLRERSANQPVETDLEATVVAAHEGRIAELFLAADRHVWGQWNAETRHIETHDERNTNDQDLLDLAAATAYLNGAKIWPIAQSELPGGSASAALLRY